ncbi:DNA polymerase III subunit delta [Tichowtungia aerotolerans]|uniref:DNA polymerase III subunit delta n=1 Tax=Tichowtungia aerotolerans TaxID=2697043 RepID=A0A6P1MCV0_9BACT|nr:DNA polymerase III subunit delta [Tichowtungia aerotolerans]QHI70404.1 DNA polymerase III subunit delta [Tichowtungia aerotolerans]
MAIKLIHGTDEYLVSHHSRKAVNALCPEEEQTLGLETIEGDVKTVDEAVSALKTAIGALRTVGLFSGQKTVWLRDVSIFKDKVISKNKEIKDLLAQLAEDIKNGLPDGQHLIISAPGVDRRSAFYKACQAGADVETYDLPEQAYLKEPIIRERAQKLFAKAQCRVSPAALDLFIEKVGMDTRQLVMEAEKLTLYIGDRNEITVDDVKAITSSSSEAIAWDFTDALGERKLDEALKILRQLIFQGEAPVALMFAIETLYRNLTQFRAYFDQGWLRLSGSRGAGSVQWAHDPEMDRMFIQLPADPRKMHWFRVGKLGQQAKNYTAEELRVCQKRLLETHEQLVSGSVAQEMILEMLVIKLVAKV